MSCSHDPDARYHGPWLGRGSAKANDACKKDIRPDIIISALTSWSIEHTHIWRRPGCKARCWRKARAILHCSPPSTSIRAVRSAGSSLLDGGHGKDNNIKGVTGLLVNIRRRKRWAALSQPVVLLLHCCCDGGGCCALATVRRKQQAKEAGRP